jgi:hypothetical protein
MNCGSQEGRLNVLTTAKAASIYKIYMLLILHGVGPPFPVENTMRIPFLFKHARPQQ